MIGLIYAESLSLTPLQWTALGINAAGWLGWHIVQPSAPYQERARWGLTIGLYLGLWSLFWNAFSVADHSLLFGQAQYLAPFEWEQFLQELPARPYVKYQPPFLTFYWSRLPSFRLHQALMFPHALLCAGLLFALYGRHAALILATPVAALMIHQPCHDTMLFGLLLLVLRLCQLGHRRVAAVVYGVTYLAKPLTLITAPFILPRLGWAGLISAAIWGGYVGWSLQYDFGRRQAQYLLHLFFIAPNTATPVGASTARGVGLAFDPLAQLWQKAAYRLAWRWEHLGRSCMQALPFYLFPAYLRRWTWPGVGAMLCVLAGFANVKYLLIPLLFAFPALPDDAPSV